MSIEKRNIRANLLVRMQIRPYVSGHVVTSALCAMLPNEGKVGPRYRIEDWRFQIKCNASQDFPAPCYGCEKAAERCYADPSFMRSQEEVLKPAQYLDFETLLTASM
jgi:hypothetical protein